MVSDWQTINTQDNDVHEVFKCIAESMLTNAFIVERPDGSVVGYNCTIEKQGNKLKVKVDKVLEANYLGWAFGTDIYQ